MLKNKNNLSEVMLQGNRITNQGATHITQGNLKFLANFTDVQLFIAQIEF
jgi:hypothetical protein